MDLKLGNNIVSKIAPTMPYLDLLEIDTIGPMASVGNRWSFDSGVMLGVDWFGWAQPLFVVKKRLNSLITYSESNRDAIDKATKTLTYFPRLHALKLQLGYQW